MADPLSLAAIAALIYTGRKLSEKKSDSGSGTPPPSSPPDARPSELLGLDTNPNMSSIMHLHAGTGDIHSSVGMRTSGKTEHPSFGDVAFMKHVSGEPVLNLRDRPYVSGKMNNFGPAEKQLVGPGLGVGADVPAYGGYQQLFQVKPNNVGAERLTTLPGRSGPAMDVSGGQPGLIGRVNHDKPSTVAYLPSRLPNVRGRGQGQGGALTGTVPRGKYEKTKIMTNRSEYTSRCDGLEFGAAKSFNTALTQAEDPTRNKGDLNTGQYSHVDNPAPGIHSFHSGFTNSAVVNMMNETNGGMYTTQQLEQAGLRPSDRRGKKDRSGNAGRMNVRANPLNQNGMITAIKADTSRTDGRSGPVNGGWSQNYVQDKFYQLNAYKGNENNRSTSKGLNIAKQQLRNNPFAHTISN